MRKQAVSLVILLFGIYSSFATSVISGSQRIETFVSKHGFYQNTISAITSDQLGYLWLATPNGLVRYDGYSFEYFYHDFSNPESIPGNKIGSLLNDAEGKLWIGTDQGVCVFLPDKEKFIPIDDGLKNEYFIKEDAQGRIWLAEGGKLRVFNASLQPAEMVDKSVSFRLEGELKDDAIVDILFLSDSEMLLASSSAIYKLAWSENQKEDYTLSRIILNFDVPEIKKIIKADNTIWLGTSNGLFQTFADDNRLVLLQRFFNSSDQKTSHSIDVLSLFLDNEKKLWIGTKRKGALKYDRNTETFIAYKFDPKNEFGLSSNRINCFFEDEYGVIWIGTAQGGLNKLDTHQKPFQNYSHNPYDKQSLSGNLITNITEDKEGRIWLSFFDNTICRTKNKIDIAEGHRLKFERLEAQLGSLKSKIVVRLFQDEKGYWWIGTLEGLYFYDDINEKLYPVNLTTNNSVFSPIGCRVIEQLSPTQMLIAGRQVYILENPWQWVTGSKPVPVDRVLIDIGKDNAVNDFEIDAFGNLWLGTQNGISRLVKDGTGFLQKDYFTNNGQNDQLRLSHNRIFCIKNSPDTTLWVGSFGGGLMKIQLGSAGEPETIKTYHKKDGLPDEVVYGILEDESGKLWMSTDMGICCFDPQTENFEVYDVNDGILSNNFRQASFLQAKNGLMLMGGLNGLTIFNPGKIAKNEILPTILISRLSINNRHIVAGRKYNNKVILNRSITETQKLVLSHQHRNISLDIIVQHTAAPQKNRLAYMLEGVNKNWIKFEGGKTTATYTNLRAGTYRFLYKGRNGDGIWTPQTGALTIRVLAPWYFRWWSLTIWSLLILLLIYGIFSYLMRLEKLKHKLKFEQLDKKRLHEIDQSKLRFFTNITHDFKTPLSLIIGPLEKIAEKYNQEEDQKYFTIIQHNISRLRKLSDQLISYRKAETGHLELKYTKTTLGDFIYPLMEAFEQSAERAHINFFYKVNAPTQTIIIDIDNTERILLNLFSNALKFTRENGEISVEAGFCMRESKPYLFFEVADNGIGIPDTQIHKIFDRFYRGVEDQATWSGTGIGLALCKALVELMKGHISVQSTPGQKTVFNVELPADVEVTAAVEEGFAKNRRIATDWVLPEFIQSKERSTDTQLPAVLIIDDEPDVRLFLQESLSDKYSVILAENGTVGMKKLEEYQPELVISDVMMPHMDGYEVCEKIKSNPQTCHIPVILLTALDDDKRMLEGLELGADDYIKKPFSMKHLETRIKSLIESKRRIIEYFSKNSGVPGEELNLPDRDRSFLKTITTSIENNLSNSEFGVEELAKLAGMSTSHLYRRLKQLTGQVPNVYIRNHRLQKAAEILKANKEITAVEVMYAIGIESPSYFSTSFKKMYGMSPIEFQKKNK